MPSQFSTLKIELIATGEQSGTWGVTTNNNLAGVSAGSRGLEQAIVGMATLVTGDFTTNVYTMSYSDTSDAQDFRALVLNITATLTGAGTINVPAIQKPYIVMNNSSGGFAVTVKVSGQTGVLVPNGAKVMVYNNGTDVGPAITYLTSLTLGSPLPVASGGTGITAFGTGVATALGQNVTGSGGIVLATSPTISSPNLGTPSSVILTNATQLPLSTGVTGTLPVANGGTGVTTSTGTGAVVLSTSPVLVTPDLGTPSAGVLTNATGLPLSTGVTGILPVANGGTGLNSTPSNGQLDIGNGTGFTRTTLQAGTNITITNGAGSITIASTAGTGTVSTVNTGSGLTGGPITTTGTISVASGGITNSMLRNSVSASVIGRAASTTGEPADIQAGTDHQVLRRSGSFLNFGAVRLDESAAVAGALSAANGGTGLTSPGASGNVLLSNGTAWTSSVAPQTYTKVASYGGGVLAAHQIVVPIDSGDGFYLIHFDNLYSTTATVDVTLQYSTNVSGSGAATGSYAFTYRRIVVGSPSSENAQSSAASIPVSGQNFITSSSSVLGLSGYLYVYKKSGFYTSVNGNTQFYGSGGTFISVLVYGTYATASNWRSLIFSGTSGNNLLGTATLYKITL